MFFDFLKFRTKKCTIKPVILLILDGWGIAPPSNGNAIYLARPLFMDSLASLYPHTQLIASGESVGLPANEVGSSEVGHLTIGAGRVILQSLKRIDNSIEDGTFFENHAFIQAVGHVRKFRSKLHLMGLVSSGKVHSSNDHLLALLEFCKREDLTDVCLHLFTDGRDAPPKDGLQIIREIETRLKMLNVARITTISGRYYAMDRDARWERTKKVYDACVLGRGEKASSAIDAIEQAYARGKTDEFIDPTIIEGPLGVSTIDDNDAIIFFNFRIDRPRQLTMAFVMPDFEHLKSFEWGYELDQGTTKKELKSGPTFKREKWPQNLFFVTMTQYQKNLPVSAIAFESKEIEDTLCEVISRANLKQLHLAESEKERMVTYYLDGLREKRFEGEDLRIIASPKVPTYDQKPEMSVEKVVEAFKGALRECKYHFFAINLANPDMVAHSSNLNATIKAIKATDRAVEVIVEESLKQEATIIISADHGNAEELITYPQQSFFYTTQKGTENTDHSNNPVPFYIIRQDLRGNPKTLEKGALSDIAPTILTLMNLPIPSVMTGINLLK